jgi:hypothetical protein
MKLTSFCLFLWGHRDSEAAKVDVLPAPEDDEMDEVDEVPGKERVRHVTLHAISLVDEVG